MSTTATPEPVTITAPNIKRMIARVVSTSPYVQLRFSEKAKGLMLADQMDPAAKKGKKKERQAKDPNELFEQAQYRDETGRAGIPASAFRNAMIRACSLVNFKMTQAKMSIFVEADGIDAIDGTPLVLIEGTPEIVTHTVRNATGVADVRVRAMWRRWAADVRISWDGDQFTETDVANLLMRAGVQVGVGEGRPSSKNSGGMGWGTFTLEGN